MGVTCRDLERKAGPAVVVNEMSQLLAAGQDLANAAQFEIDGGDLLIGFEMLGLDDATGASDDLLSAAFEIEEDMDGEALDNFSGSEPLCIDPSTLDDNDDPVTQLSSSISDFHLHGEADTLSLPSFTAGVTIPAIPIHGIVLDATVQTDLAGWSDGAMSGVIWAADLSQLSIAGLNLLTLVACGGLGGQIAPTSLMIDVDGDGLEVIACDEFGSIDSCTDYDPKTGKAFVENGEDCAEMLADGYEFFMTFETVSFVIEGVLVP